MISLIPLMIFPLAFYNLVLSGLFGSATGEIFQNTISSLKMMSGATWTMSSGDLLIAVSLLVLFAEIMKSTRRTAFSVVDHLLSLLLFIGFLIEFLLVPGAATQVFFILMLISFVDVAAGFSISIRAASRDVSIGL